MTRARRLQRNLPPVLNGECAVAITVFSTGSKTQYSRSSSSVPATAARSTGDKKVELRTGMPVNQRRAIASRDPDRRLGPYRGGIPKQTAAPMPEPRFRGRFIDGSRALLPER